MKAKRTLSLALAVLMALSLITIGVAAEDSPNMFYNGSFDDAANISNYWWIEPGNTYRGGTCTYSTSGGVNGTGCIRMAGAASGAVNLGYRNQVDGGKMFAKVESGKQYIYSVDVFRPAGVTADIRIDAENGMGAPTVHATKNGEWETLTGSFTASGTGEFYSRILSDGAGLLAADQYILIDNYSLVCTSDASAAPAYSGTDASPSDADTYGANLFDNGNFNLYNGGTIWARDDWNSSSGGGRPTYSNTAGIDGTGAYVFTGGTGTDAGRNAGLVMSDSNNMVALTAGKYYQLSAKVLRPAGVTAPVYVSLRLPTDAPLFESDATVKNGEWETISVRFKAPETASYYTWVRAQALPNGAQVIVDDVALREVGGTPDPNEGVTLEPGKNLIPGGDFNTANGNGAWARGDWNAIDGGGLFNYTSMKGIDGGGGFIATGGNGTAADRKVCLVLTKDALDLTDGKAYELSAQIYRPDGVSSPFFVSARNTDDSPIASSDATVKNGEWETVKTSFVANGDKVFLWLYGVELPEGQQVIVDNVALRELGGEKGAEEEDWVLGGNLFVNGDINASDNAPWWFRDDWNGGYFRFAPKKGVDGSNALVAEGKGAGTADQYAGVYYGNKLVDQLKPGSIYVMSAKVFRPAGVDAPVSLAIRYANDSVFAQSDSSEKNGEWETIRVAFIAPEEPINFSVIANALAAGEKIYVDDITVQEVGGDPNANPFTGDFILPLTLVAALAATGCALLIRRRRMAASV